MSVSIDAKQEQINSVDHLRACYASQEADAILRAMIETEFAGKICVVSSFGSESAVLLHKVAQIDPTVPIIFLNTGKLFGETLRFRDRLQTQLGLTDIRTIGPHPDDLKQLDTAGDLWSRDADKCCHIRKVLPQQRALKNFDAVITGRKRFQTSAREKMHMIELEDAVTGRVRINPLADFDLASLEAYMDAHKLPRHPLVKDGYLSIGCMPCTSKVKEGEDYRSGRWAQSEKEECGIHASEFVDGDGI